ncbi:major facilitator superfamily domain-containing protein [Xylariaceae sp. FL1272]|nr:major facilitator superfamily domain-containing protein [Xylariaceae sp. FL1272]
MEGKQQIYQVPKFSDSVVTLTEPEPIEPPKPDNTLTWFRRQTDHASITPAVLEWRYKGQGTPEDPYVVDFIPNDNRNALLFPAWKKWSITVFKAIAVLAVAFVSTAYSSSLGSIIDEFEISPELALSGVSLFVLGFAIGPLFWAPLGEMYGRQVTFFISYAFLTFFNGVTIASKNIGTIAVLRFFAGAFGSSPLTNSGGVIADMFLPKDRGFATALFATAPFLGPAIGPIAGGFLSDAAGWRWVEALMAFFTGTLWIAVSLYVPETYAPVLLRKRAVALTKLTGHTYMSKLDVGRPKKTKFEQFKIALSRPWILLFREPIVFLLTIYLAIIYGTLYLMFAAFPIIFEEIRHWGNGISGLAYLGLAVGMVGAVLYSGFDNLRYQKICIANGGLPVPEARLRPSLIGSFLCPIGLFIFAFTNGPEVHWIVPIIASGIFGSGLVAVFLSSTNYLVDSYTVYAASVLAANSILRSLFGAAFPLFTSPLYAAAGIHWGSTVPAFLALICLPFPWIFNKYGARIRAKCKYAAEAQEMLKKIRMQMQAAQAGGANDKVRLEKPKPVQTV